MPQAAAAHLGHQALPSSELCKAVPGGLSKELCWNSVWNFSEAAANQNTSPAKAASHLLK